MADLVLGTSIVANGGSEFDDGIAGETLAAAQWVYLNDSGKWMLAQADDLETSEHTGITLNGAVLNGHVRVHRRGKLTLAGATLTKGTPIYGSAANAGAFAPYADLAATNHPVYVGVALSATTVDFLVHEAGVVL